MSIGINKSPLNCVSGGEFLQDTWTNPNYAISNDGQRASSIDDTQTLRATNFDFNIPQDAIIEGIQVNVEKRGIGSTPSVDRVVQIIGANGIQIGNDKAKVDNWPTNDTVTQYGGPNDLWGIEGLTPEDINHANFGVAISAQGDANSIHHIDHINMTVYFASSNCKKSGQVNINIQISC